MAYIIQDLNDPILDKLYEGDIIPMCIGRMAYRSEYGGWITLGDGVVEHFRKKYYNKEGNLYKLKEEYDLNH